MISAINDLPHDFSFAEVLTDQVVNRDFSGYTLLQEMEKEPAKLVIKAIRKKHGQ